MLSRTLWAIAGPSFALRYMHVRHAASRALQHCCATMILRCAGFGTGNVEVYDANGRLGGGAFLSSLLLA